MRHMLAGAWFSTFVIDLIGFFALASLSGSSPSNPVFADFLAGFATSFTCRKTDGTITSRKRTDGLLARLPAPHRPG
ncbi:hypothetical protein ACF8OH_21290 [Delftia sp. WSY_9]|uniref:hypothetical protein n=1 Tax=unclassified Delftia TaxID=2613839 RepID=UPI00370AB989